MSTEPTIHCDRCGRWTTPGLLAAVFVLALSVRLAYMIQTMAGPLFDVPQTDARWHAEWARQIAEGRWSSDKPLFRAPLYPLFLAGAYRLTGDSFTGARVIQHVLGAVSCVLVVLLGRRVFDARVGWIAGVVCALYAPLVYFENELLIPPLAIVLFLSMWLLLAAALERPAWPRWLGAGVLLGLCAITRPTFLALAPLVALWTLLAPRATRGWRLRGVDTALLTAGTLAAILPVTLHNRFAGGEWVLIGTQGGVNFVIGNHPGADGKTAVAFTPREWEYHNEYVDNVWWTSRVNAEMLAGRHLSEAEVSNFWYRQGANFWRRYPGDALRLLMRKAYYLLNGFEIESNRSMYLDRLWSPLAVALLSSEQAWIAYPFGLLGPLAIIGLLWRRRAGPMPDLLRAAVLVYALVIIAFFVTGRFRAPLVPLLALFAADAAARLFDAARARHYAVIRLGGLALAALLVFCNSPFFGVREINYSRQAGLLGSAYAESGQPRRALAYYAEALKTAPADNYKAPMSLGQVQLELGQFAEAEASFLLALERSPGLPAAQVLLGNALLAQGRDVESRVVLEQVLAQEPDNGYAHLLVARLDALADQRAAAQDHLAAAQAAGVSVPDGWLTPTTQSTEAPSP